MQDATIKTISAGQEARSGGPHSSNACSGDDSHPPVGTGQPEPETQTQSAIERLAVSPRDLPTLSCDCRNHRQLKHWLQGYLQQMDGERAPRTAGTLRNLMAEITRWQAPPRRRLACLEALRPTTVNLVTELSRGQQPQTPEARRNVLIACILFQHLAQSYTSIAIELVHSPLSLFHRRTLALCLHRAVDSYRRLILSSCHAFLATPKHSWVRMQSLVQLAQEQQLATFKVRDALADCDTKTPSHWVRRQSVITPYFQIALFASANPLQLDSEGQRQIWKLCRDWAKSCLLIPRPTGSGTVLLSSLRLDQAPLPHARLQRTRLDMKHFSQPSGWAIDLQGPLHYLDKRLRKPGAVPLDLLQQVHALWAGEKGRDTVRTPVNIRCEAVLGISGICFQLRQESESEIPVSKPQTVSTALAEGGGRKLLMDVDTIDFQTGRQLADYDVTLPDAPCSRREQEARARQQQLRYRPIPATLLNLSARGAGLRLPQTTLGKVHSGDLIGLTINGRWQVALVRWQYALPDHCRVGVELLGGHTSAVRVHRYNQTGQRTEAIPALLTGDAGGAPELILPVPLFQPGDRVDIVTAGNIRSVTLHRSNMTTGSFAIFEFS